MSFRLNAICSVFFFCTFAFFTARAAQHTVEIEKKIWEMEDLAQEHVAYFEHVWDVFNASRPMFWEVLKTVDFEVINYSALESSTLLNDNFKQSRMGEATLSMSKGQFHEWIKNQKKQGVEVQQIEFHQEKFWMDDEKKFHSQINSVFNAFNPKEGKYFSIKVPMIVKWSGRKNSMGQPIPEKISLTGLILTETTWEKSKLPFVEVANFSGNKNKYGPLIASDIDSDGDIDILVPLQNSLLKNNGKGKFTKTPLLKKAYDVTSALLEDLDGDGFKDLLLCNTSGEPIVFKGMGKGKFSDSATTIKIPGGKIENSFNITAGDIDGDGDLDLWVTQYLAPGFKNYPQLFYDANDGLPSYLLVNQGEFKFNDETEARGLAVKRNRRTYSSSFFDFDQDGDLDIINVSDFSGVDLYLNQGQGKFVDKTSDMVDRRENFGMAHAISDLNGDGQLDIYVSGMASTTARRLINMGLGRSEYKDIDKMRYEMAYGNRLYLGKNRGQKFKQAEFNDSINKSGWSWGTVAFDVQNDGESDIFVANGHLSKKSVADYCSEFWRYDIYPKEVNIQTNRAKKTDLMNFSWNGYEHDVLYANLGEGKFWNISYLLGISFEDDDRNVLVEDINNDGHMDLVLQNRFGVVRIIENRWKNNNNWIGINFSEKPGINLQGATVKVIGENRTWPIALVSGDSFRSQGSFHRSVGVGNERAVKAIEIVLSNGKVIRKEAPEINRYNQISL